MKKHPREFGWLQELTLRRTIPMSDVEYIDLDEEKKVVWLSFLEGEQKQQEKQMKEAIKKSKRGRKR
jgi:hypothetical protein